MASNRRVPYTPSYDNVMRQTQGSSIPRAEEPPSYQSAVATVYDETYRGIWWMSTAINSMANQPNIIGYLEHHKPTTDGSFAICAAGGTGVFVKKSLWESIPSARRPTLDTSEAGREIALLTGGSIVALGSVFFPFLLTNKNTGERMRYIIKALVVPNLLMGMFIGATGGASIIQAQGWEGGDGPVFTVKCRDSTCKVQGV